MSRANKRLEELKPFLEKHKQKVSELTLAAEQLKETFNKSTKAYQIKTEGVKIRLKTELSNQSSVFSRIPSANSLYDRLPVLRSTRADHTQQAIALRKLKYRHSKIQSKYMAACKVLEVERKKHSLLQIEFNKLEVALAKAVQRREQRKNNKQHKQA